MKKYIFKILLIIFCAFTYPVFVNAQNTLSVKTLTTSSNKSISIEIQLNNKDSITAVQFDLNFNSNGVILPSVVDSLIKTNRTTDHSPQLSVVGNNTIRVILFNLSNKNIRDTSGTILIVKSLSGSLPGVYNSLITNVTLANASGQSLSSSVTSGGITIQSPKISVNSPINLGRIPLLKNYSSNIYVQNIGNQNLIIKGVASSSNRLTINSSFPTLPYTLSSNSGVNVNYSLLPNSKGVQTDTLTISSNEPSVDSIKKVAFNYTAYPVNAIVLNNQYIGTYNTSLSIPITINNFDTLAGFQFTLRLPEGIKYVDNSISLNAQRISDHLITANQTGNNLTIVGYSPSNSPFKNNTGEMLTLRVLLDKEGGTYSTTMFGCVLSNLKGNNVISDSTNTQIVVRSPQLQINSTLMNFGSITTKQSTSFNLSLNNNGTDTLVINQVIIPFSAITAATTLPLKIAPSSSTFIRFNFSSNKPINIDSSITIRSNDPLGDKKVLVKAISYSKNEITTPVSAGFQNSYLRVPLLITNYDTLQGLQFDVRISDINSVRFTDSSFRIAEKFKNLNYSTQILDSSNLRVLLFSLTGNKILPDSNWLGEIRLQSKKGELQGSFGSMNFQNGIISNNSNVNVASNFAGTNLNLCSIAKPSISFSPSSVVCDSSVLISSSLGTIQTLFKNDTIQPINTVRANSAANWSAIVSSNGCFYISNIQSTTKAQQPPAPIVFTLGDSAVCSGKSVMIYSSAKGNNQWFRNNVLIPNATDTTFIATTSGSYGVKYSPGGCSSPISNLLTILIRDSIPKPLVNNVSLCIGSTAAPLTATALPGNSLRWYLTNNINDTARTIAPTPSTSKADTTTYYVSQVGAGGCESERVAIRVSVTAKLPTPTVQNLTLCLGSTAAPLTATALPGNSLRWYNSNQPSDTALSSAPIPSTSKVDTTTYYVSQVGASGCESDRIAIRVTVTAKLPTPTVQNLTLCLGSTAAPLTATASAGNSLRWYYTNQPSDTSLGVVPIPSTSRVDTNIYYVSQVGAGGCESDRAAIRVTVTAKLPPPTIQNVTLCLGSTANPLTATTLPGNSLRWYYTNQPSDTALGVAPIPSTVSVTTSDYYVSQVGAVGCESDRVAIRVTVTAKLTPPTVQNLTVCLGSTAAPLTATASSGNSLRWYLTNNISDTARTTAPIPSTSKADTTNFYVSQVGASGCESDRVAIRVIVTAKLPAPTVQNLALCLGSTASPLTATTLPGNSLRWYYTNQPSDTALGAVPIPSTTRVDTTTYYVSQVGASGCESDRIAIRVTVTAKLPPPIVSNASICLGALTGPLTATASNGYILRWYKTNSFSDTVLNSAPIPSSATAGTINYYVSQISTSGCESDRAMITVTVSAKQPSPTVSNITLCLGTTASPLVATALAGNSLRWYKSNSLNDSASTISPTPSTAIIGTTNYYVSQINIGGCESDRAVITVTVITSPIPIITNTTPTSFCLGGSVNLSSSIASNNQWFKNDTLIIGATNQIYTATQAGAYYVNVTNAAGCKSASIKTIVTVNPIPAKPIITKSGVDLISSSKVGNIWLRESNIITGANDSMYRPLVSGNYRVQVRVNGCLGPTSDPYFYLVTSVVNTNTSADNYKLFPNPVRDKILIDAGTSIHKISFQIFDTNGRKMMSNSFTKSTMVDLSSLNSGTYTILITNTKTLKQESKQIVKQ